MLAEFYKHLNRVQLGKFLRSSIPSYLLTNGNGAGERLGRGGDLDAGHHSIVPEPALARLLKAVVDQDGLTVVQVFQLHPPLLQ